MGQAIGTGQQAIVKEAKETRRFFLLMPVAFCLFFIDMKGPFP
jgi:hypothetical protein